MNASLHFFVAKEMKRRDEDKTAGSLHYACDAFSVMVNFPLSCNMA
jgi:hypothetical protein